MGNIIFQPNSLYTLTVLFSYLYINLNRFGERLEKLCSLKVLTMLKNVIIHTKLALQSEWSSLLKTGGLSPWNKLTYWVVSGKRHSQGEIVSWVLRIIWSGSGHGCWLNMASFCVKRQLHQHFALGVAELSRAQHVGILGCCSACLTHRARTWPIGDAYSVSRYRQDKEVRTCAHL